MTRTGLIALTVMALTFVTISVVSFTQSSLSLSNHKSIQASSIAGVK